MKRQEKHKKYFKASCIGPSIYLFLEISTSTRIKFPLLGKSYKFPQIPDHSEQCWADECLKITDLELLASILDIICLTLFSHKMELAKRNNDLAKVIYIIKI